MKTKAIKPYLFFRKINFKNCIYIGAFLGAMIVSVGYLFIGATMVRESIRPEYTFLMTGPAILFFMLLGAFAGSLGGALVGLITLD